MSRPLSPTSVEEAAGELAQASRAGETIRIVGAGTKASWGTQGGTFDRELQTGGLNRLVEHNAGDLTAVLESGLPLARAQATFAAAGQMLALDPWLGPQDEATIGGVLATADSGPLRHRYGAPRDLVLGMTVALPDGAVARSGSKVIKNVAGYDLAKLFCGAFGTLGLIASVSVRLHPLPLATATAIGTTRDPDVLAEAARSLAAAPLELERLDFSWKPKIGMLLAPCGGAKATDRARRAQAMMAEHGLDHTDVVTEDEDTWADQRMRQRSAERAIVRAAARPSRLAGVFRASTASGASAVGRASLGHCFIHVEAEAVPRLVNALPKGTVWTLADAPDCTPSSVSVWGTGPPQGAASLMTRIKLRFDPTGTCNRGLFVDGI